MESWELKKEDEYTFKVTLVFWKFYELNCYFSLPKVREFLKQEGTYKVYDSYHFEIEKDGAVIHQPLKWISSQSHLYAPVCFKLGIDRFSCKTSPNIVGQLRLEGHIHYGQVLVIHCEFLFDNYHAIEEFIEISQPSNVILVSTGLPITEKFQEIRENICELLINSGKFAHKESKASTLEPWHHTWIIWDAKPDFKKSDYRFEGQDVRKNARYSIGLTLRTDKWRELDPVAYRDQIKLKNLSPYTDEFVMITHAGNVIIPGAGLLDPNAMKNFLIDTLFAPEVGNVQRYLILMHMHNILTIAEEFDKSIFETQARKKKLTLNQKITKLEDLESGLNQTILELNKDIIIFKISRLLFTSTFKTSMFLEMIEKLDGFKFSEQTDDVIKRIRDTLKKEREKLNTRANEIENKFLALLNYLAVFEIGLVLIALFFEEIWTGIVEVGLAILLVLMVLFIYRAREKRT
jgi:hypothetical protein